MITTELLWGSDVAPSVTGRVDKCRTGNLLTQVFPFIQKCGIVIIKAKCRRLQLSQGVNRSVCLR